MRSYHKSNGIVVRRGAAYDTLSAPNAKGEIETVDFSHAKANQRQAVIDEIIHRLEARKFFEKTVMEVVNG